jgi:hypothetical protein
MCVLVVGIGAQPLPSDPSLDVVLRTELQRCPEGCVIDLINGEPASVAFLDLLLTVGQPYGIAELPDSSEQFACAFNPKGRKVADYLDAITAAEPRYRWTRTNDVLNLVPVEEPALLTTVISEFSAKDENVVALIAKLKQNRDFLVACKRLNLVDRSSLKEASGPYGFVFGGALKVAQPTMLISLRLEHLTVRQILNEIVKRDGSWNYREYSRADGTFGFDMYIGDYYTGPPRKG